jgi:leucyl aminopeptidase
MEIKVLVGDVTEVPVDALLVNLFEGVKTPGGATGAVDKALGGAISQLISQGEIKGKLKEATVIHALGRIKPARVVVVGLGKQSELTLDKVRGVMATACRSLRQIGAKGIATICHGAGIGGVEPEEAAQAIVEGTILGLYSFRRHLTEEPEHGEIEQLIIVEREENKAPALERGSYKGRVTAEAVNSARDMINEPANFMTPTHMAQRAREVAEIHELELTILEREQMEELGMGAFLGVAQGSRQPPKMIVLHYKGDGDSKGALGLVGKGITFDSGGISIKPSEGLGDMKGDMAGGAAILAAISGIAQLKPKINVTAIIPATENLPGGAALKPGDVLKSMNGKSIEIISTDAEGRLILADALCYAQKLGLSPLVDVATLTGACHVALGDFCSGAFGSDQELIEKVIKAGSEAGEYIWQIPMYEEYKEQIKSDVADIKNVGGRYGGAITAAQFLAEFTGDTPWVHLDIAGTSRSEKDRNYSVKGASGVMVRSLINLAINLSQERGSGGG